MTSWMSCGLLKLSVTNWGDYPVILKKNTVIGTVEVASLVSPDDPVWRDPVQLTESIVRVCQVKAESSP